MYFENLFQLKAEIVMLLFIIPRCRTFVPVKYEIVNSQCPLLVLILYCTNLFAYVKIQRVDTSFRLVYLVQPLIVHIIIII